MGLDGASNFLHHKKRRAPKFPGPVAFCGGGKKSSVVVTLSAWNQYCAPSFAFRYSALMETVPVKLPTLLWPSRSVALM